MRISTSMMMKNYTKTLDDKLTNVDKYSNQVSSSRKFQRASEDPVAAMQTIESCHAYVDNRQYATSETNANSWMQATESTVDQLNSILKSAQEKATEAINGTNNDSDRQNLAMAMGSYRDELVQTLNTSFSGRYIFGEGSDGKPPFKMGTTAEDGAANDGKLMYYNYKATTPGYVAVGSITKTDASSMKLTMPVDLNMGLQITGNSVKSSTAFEAATSGLDTIISDFSGASGTATNIVDKLTDAVSNLNSGNIAGLSTILGDVQKAQSAVLKVDVGIGEKSKMLSFISSKLTDDETNITNRLASSMEVDSVEAIMKLNISKTVYNESMSITSTVLQQSLIDFLK